MVDQDAITIAIKSLCESYWDEHKEPLLLSALPPMLEKEVPDYRSVLKRRTLKAFIKETGQGKYKLIEHPTQRVRVGIIPSGIEYAFPSSQQSSVKVTTTVPKVVASNSREATLAFLQVLSTLSEDDLSTVIIPTPVLIKLLK